MMLRIDDVHVKLVRNWYLPISVAALFHVTIYPIGWTLLYCYAVIQVCRWIWRRR